MKLTFAVSAAVENTWRFSHKICEMSRHQMTKIKCNKWKMESVFTCINEQCFLSMTRDSVRGCVHPLVHPSIRQLVSLSLTLTQTNDLHCSIMNVRFHFFQIGHHGRRDKRTDITHAPHLGGKWSVQWGLSLVIVTKRVENLHNWLNKVYYLI